MLIDSENLDRQLENFKKKFYVSLLLKGLLLTSGILLFGFIVLSTAEFFGQFSSTVRLSFLIIFIISLTILFLKYLYIPCLNLLGFAKDLTDEGAAKNIGKYYGNINDKLLNVVQLKLADIQGSPLAIAAYLQKKEQFKNIDFSKAAEIKNTSKYIGAIGIPIFVILIISWFMPNFFIDSTKRIYHFNKEFDKIIPYQFSVIDLKKYALRGENINIRLQISGKFLPKDVYITFSDNPVKLVLNENKEYIYTIKNIQRTSNFRFLAGQYESKDYQIPVVASPSIMQLDCKVVYPSYINKKEGTFINSGNIIVPEGSQITWQLKTHASNDIKLKFNEPSKFEIYKSKSEIIGEESISIFNKKITHSENYLVIVTNKKITSLVDSISYQLSCIKDLNPIISSIGIVDSSQYKNISIAGNIADDYGLSKLQLHYEVIEQEGKKGIIGNKLIGFDKQFKEQKYFIQWNIDSILTNENQKLKYYVEVWDNDGINGSKSTRTTIYEVALPSKKELEKKISSSSKESLLSMQSLKKDSETSEKEISDLENKLKTKSNLTWQDKKEISDFIKDKKKNNKTVDVLKEKLTELNNQKKLQDKPSELLEEKLKSLTELMNNLLDEETKKMYEQLEKLMNNPVNKEEIDKMLKNLSMKEGQFKNEVDKMLEMFKQIQFEEKLESSIKKLEKLANEQTKLSEKTLDKKSLEKSESLNNEQKKLNEEVENAKKELSELDKLNNDLENKQPLPDKYEQLKEISDLQNKASKSLEKDNKKQAGESEKKAGEKLEELSKEMAQMQQAGQEEQAAENIKDLRNILENLVQLSFDQENILKGFKKVAQSDPEFIVLSQKQLKIKSDSKVIEDSLLALSKRVFQIKSFVTRELNQMNSYLDESTNSIKSRRTDYIITKQQYAMTSMNNLALMLDDVLKQMQQQMAQSQKSGSKSCSKPQNKPGKNPGLSDLQKQLGKKAGEMMKSGKDGKGMSEELAKMAAQQEYIRRALQEMQKNSDKKGGSKPGNSLDDLIKAMEKNEEDLVNKRLNQEQVNRQQEILTRLIESEKAIKERELDENREAERANNISQAQPNNVLKAFLLKKQGEVDLLKTVSPNLNPFYKKESNSYFNAIQ